VDQGESFILDHSLESVRDEVNCYFNRMESVIRLRYSSGELVYTSPVAATCDDGNLDVLRGIYFTSNAYRMTKESLRELPSCKELQD
jgi:hypothetical protein